jgi:hypothetical protein
MFNFEIRNTIKRLAPPQLRKPKFIAWLYRMLIKLRHKKTEFDALRTYWDYNLKFSSQTMSLEARLNQQYNLIMGSIYIVTQNSANDAVYTFWINENQPSPFIYFLAEGNTPTFITWLGEGSASALDFIVYVPFTLVFDENEMRAIIDLYRLAGKRYAIELY